MTGWELDDAVGLVQRGAVLFVGLLDEGRVIALDSTAPLVLAVALDPTVDDVVAGVAAAVDHPADDVRAGVERCLTTLHEIGVLRRRA